MYKEEGRNFPSSFFFFLLLKPMYNKKDDIIESKGYIDRDEILKFVSEEEIFELVFGFLPEEFLHAVSPFRVDNKPNCWFQYYPSGKLKFVDFASKIIIRGKQMVNIDCFDAVQIYFKLPNYYETLKFIRDTLIDGKRIAGVEVPERTLSEFITYKKKEVKIYIENRDFEGKDARYFKKYEISSQNLIEDKVFAVTKLKLIDTKSGDHTIYCNDLCYAHTNFNNGKKKIHRPMQKGSKRFITNCTQNDIYGLKGLPKFGDLLMIKKSYKDYRVIKNQGLCTIAFQNEGMIPSNEILLPIVKGYKRVVVFFDNDEAGITAGKKVVDHINSFFPGKARAIHLPIDLKDKGITDPSDLIHKRGRPHLLNFLKQSKIL